MAIPLREQPLSNQELHELVRHWVVKDLGPHGTLVERFPRPKNGKREALSPRATNVMRGKE